MKRLKILFSLLFLSFEIWAQDPQFSMFYSVPLYLNPAFAGSRHANRVLTHHRFQWTNQPGNYFPQSYLSFDTYVNKYKSGIGGSLMYDRQGDGAVKSFWFNMVYSYELKINNNNIIRFGLQGGLIQQSVEVGSLPSQFDNTLGFVGGASPVISPKIVPDISAGVLYYAKRLYVSLTTHHLNRPNQSFFVTSGDAGKLPIRFTAAIGYKIPLILNTGSAGMHNGNPTMMSLTPTISYRKQLTNDQVDVGLYWGYKWMIAGAWYRGIPFKQFQRTLATGNIQNVQNNESIVFLIGATYMGLGFGYSYDLTVSTQPGTGGSHEVHLSYVFKTNGRKQPKSLPCPDFEYDILRRAGQGQGTVR